MRVIASVLLLALAVLWGPASAGAETRVALVMGNSAYRHTAKLSNPVNDASLIASILRRQDFEVLLHLDLDFKSMRRAIKAFTTKLEENGRDTVGLVFYAGHGLQSEGINYLVPVDARIDKEGDIPVEAVDVSSLLGAIRIAGNRLNIVILDACRNNPYAASFRSAGRGLARIDAPVGSLIAYSTAPGSVAADGNSANSPYTQALASAMTRPGLKVEDVFKRTRQVVYDATGGKQVPWESSSVFGDFYFEPAATATRGDDADEEAEDQSVEIAFWESVKDSDNPQLLQTYLDKYPDGAFAPIARTMIDQMKTRSAVGRTTNDSGEERPAPAPAAANPFDGVWKIVRVSPSCKQLRQKNVTFTISIKDGRIIWQRGKGFVNKRGTFRAISSVKNGRQAIYVGRLKGDDGNGRFIGKRLGKGVGCKGMITLTRLSK